MYCKQACVKEREGESEGKRECAHTDCMPVLQALSGMLLHLSLYLFLSPLPLLLTWSLHYVTDIRYYVPVCVSVYASVSFFMNVCLLGLFVYVQCVQSDMLIYIFLMCGCGSAYFGIHKAELVSTLLVMSFDNLPFGLI